MFERGRKSGEKNSSGCGLGPRMWLDFPEMMKELSPDKVPSMRPGAAARCYFVDKEGVVSGYVMSRPTESVSYEPAKSFITMNVYRSDFDPWIAEFAVRAGAEVRNSTLIVNLVKEKGKVVGVQDEKGVKYKAPIVIGADGAVSMVAKKSGLRSKWEQDQVTLVPQYDFSADPQKIDDIMGDEALAVWWSAVFPAAYQVFFRDGFHIGLGNWMTWWDKNPLYYLNQCVNLKYFQRIMRLIDAKPRELQAHLLPWMSYPVDTHTDNVILIGDAAGFPCPLEAEGIYPAMISGRAAAETAIKCIAEGDTSKKALSLYDEKWKATSVGEEFESGAELAGIWRKLPFTPKTMEWFIPMWMELLGGIYDWSQPHVARFRQILNKIQTYQSEYIPFALKYVMPLIAEVLKDDVETIKSMNDLMQKMLPKKKKGGSK